MEDFSSDKAVPREISALLSGERLKLRETERAVTPFGGLVVFVEYLNRIDLMGAVRRHMPVRYLSPNQIDPSTTLICFLVSVLAGARRFAHAAWLRGDKALHRCWAWIAFLLTIPSAICCAGSRWATCSGCSNR
jgi:hypothetical protein